MATSIKPLKLFYCYVREDKALRDELDNHLSLLKRQQQITSWYDREIIPGVEWEKEIDAQLNNAHIILLLVSASFLASDYCYGIEMKQALERHAARTARVIPIILRRVYWEDAPFGHLQVLPTDAKPVTQWHDRDEAFWDITQGLRRAVKELQSLREIKEELLGEGSTLNSLKQYEEAIQAYNHAISMNPNNAEAYNDKGFVLNKLGEYEEAIKAINQAIILNTNNAEAYHNKGYALDGLRRYEEAIQAYNHAIEIASNYVNAYYNKGLALNNLGRYEEAIQAYNQALILDPNYISAYVNKGVALNNLRGYEEAIQAYNQALILDPNDECTYNNKGATLENLNRYEEAIQAYDQALKINPYYTNARKSRDIALQKLRRSNINFTDNINLK